MSGDIGIMPSKSVSHRAAVCAALAGEGEVRGIGRSLDIQATCGALNSLGFRCEFSGSLLRAAGARRTPAQSRVVECGESGSTLRLLLPLALDGVPTKFTGKGRLMERPMKPYEDMFTGLGIEFEHTPGGIKVLGKLESGVFFLPGDVSSQFISGLLFALPRLNGPSSVILTSPLESRSYVVLTIRTLAAFGIEIRGVVKNGRECFEIPGGQAYRPSRVSVEGDYSHAAFWSVAGAMGGGALLRGLDKNSAQGDAAIIDILRKMNADIEWQGGELCVRPSRLRGAKIDISQTPDIFPALAVAAAAAEGDTELCGGSRLRIKESDRLSAMARELAALGADVRESADALYVKGRGRLSGGSVSAHADHRIAMSLAVAASVCEKAVIIDDAECVRKSAPDFWQEYSGMGGVFRLSDEVR